MGGSSSTVSADGTAAPHCEGCASHSAACQQLWKDRADALFTDVTLQCSSSQVVMAHRNILCAASSVFRSLLVTGATKRDQLSLPDFTSEQLLLYLEYIYTRSIKQYRNAEALVHGIYAAHQYGPSEFYECMKLQLLSLLKRECGSVDGAVSAASVLNMLQRLPEADALAFAPLARQIVILNLSELLSVGCLSYDVLYEAITASDLKWRPPESAIFEAVNQWATAFCFTKDQEPSVSNKKSALGSLLLVFQGEASLVW